MKLVFATNNQHKLKEARQIAPGLVIESLFDIGCEDELPETGQTLEQNAMQKAFYVSEKYGVDCFSDDTGLEVEALNGEPGVYSARYSGRDATSARNIEKLLREMKDTVNRNARFRTVIALVVNGDKKLFEGEVRGRITEAVTGEGGFGYDPVFIPEGETRTFAEMSAGEKNHYSHRSRALRAMLDYLEASVLRG